MIKILETGSIFDLEGSIYDLIQRMHNIMDKNKIKKQIKIRFCDCTGGVNSGGDVNDYEIYHD